jgi:hypothetical protein
MNSIEINADFKTKDKNIELYIMGFVFLVLFLMPVIFTRVRGEISWLHVVKIWKDQSLLIPLFILNHWILVPKQMLRKKYFSYIISIVSLIAFFTFSYYYYDIVLNSKPIVIQNVDLNRPTPIPPYAELLIFSVLIVGVDTGLLFSKKWQNNEKERQVLVRKNAEMELEILRNQISPHFFMNTLNNIYALIDFDSPKAKEAVMKLSKLMRYMLYENENGKVKLSKEFEFIKSYIDLMRLRFVDDKIIQYVVPEQYEDIEIPPLLFISFIENAFKHGASYENESEICITFSIDNNTLIFNCENIKHLRFATKEIGGIGMPNSLSRLKLLYGENYFLEIKSTDQKYQVELKIPLT